MEVTSTLQLVAQQYIIDAASASQTAVTCALTVLLSHVQDTCQVEGTFT